MARLSLTIQYDGTRYHGWQVQRNARTVQEVLQDAVERITAEKRKFGMKSLYLNGLYFSMGPSPLTPGTPKK